MYNSSFRSAIRWSVIVAAVLFSTSAAHADPVVNLNFNSLSSGANASAIQTYIQQQMNAAGYSGTVTVHSNAGEANGYNGDGFVVGPATRTGVTSLFLGNTDNGVQHSNDDDRFLINQSGSFFSISFSTPIQGAAFDFQIFPNFQVADGTNVPASQYPDFTFKAYANSTLLVSEQVFGVMPGTNGTFPHSPKSGTGANELAPQLMGHMSFPLAGATKLEFIDWPVRIGIDNLDLTLSQSNPPVHTPEPASIMVFAVSMGACGVGYLWRRKRAMA